MFGRDIKIVYASASGNVEAVCMKVAEVLSSHSYNPIMMRAEATDISEIVTGQLFVFSASTWEHGRLSPFFEPLLKEMKKIDMSGKYAGLIGLGDTRYEPVNFCEGINIIERGFTGKGGKVLGEVMKIDGDPYARLDGDVTEWTHKFVQEIMEISKGQ